MLASQDEQYVEVYRKAMGWKQERYVSGETVKLDRLDLDGVAACFGVRGCVLKHLGDQG